MSLFGTYFQKTLRWLPIAKPGPLAALVLGAAKVLDSVRAPVLWLRDQFLPRSCEDDLLPDHAAARGVPLWPEETNGQLRQRIETAWAWHRLGGLNVGLPEILSYYGYPGTQIVNLRYEDLARWAEFMVELFPPLGGYTEQELVDIRTVADDQKPARSKCAALRITTGCEIQIRFAAVTQLTCVMAIMAYIAGTAAFKDREGATFDDRVGATFDDR